MYRFPREILAHNQAAWVWLVIGIILNDFTMYYREIYFFECQAVGECFFVSMIGNAYAIIADSVNDVLNVHCKTLELNKLVSIPPACSPFLTPHLTKLQDAQL